jgi:PAS domain S-box-containing protein
MVATARPDGFRDFFNQRWLEYLGRPLKDVQGFGRQDAIHPEDLARYMDLRHATLTTGEPFEAEVRLRGADGRYHWFLQRAAALRNEHGNIFKWYEATSDIEDRKRAEEMQHEQARLLDLTHDTVFVRDLNDRITYWNRGAALLYGWTKQQALGKITHELLQTAFPEPIEEITAKLLRTARWEGELIHTKRDGTRVTVSSRWALMRDERGAPAATLETNNDITGRKQAEVALRVAEADLAHVSRMTTMGELAASLAHDVNQPIAAAVTNANACLRWLAGDTPNLEEARAACMRIARDGTRAAEIISRLRVLFKKEALTRELVEVNQLIQEMIVLLQGEVTRYSVSVRTELRPDLPQVMGDQVQLQQVMMNLILNSIEAMKDVDGLRELTIKSQQVENKQIMVSIADNGAGLPEQQADKIFNTFFTTKAHGIGMGLPISRSIVESHGGCLWGAGNSKGGATFHFTLPTNAKALE